MIWNPFSRVTTVPAKEPADIHDETSLSSYAQWSNCLEALSKGDDDEACLKRLSAGSLSWTGGVAPMFVERVSQEVQRRLGICSTRLTRDLQSGGQETVIVRAIVQARQQLDFVHRLCHLPALPETTRQQLAAEVARFAQRAQSSLQDSAKVDRSGRLEVLFKNNPLTRYLSADPSSQPFSAAEASSLGGKPAKRNILL